MRRRVRRNYTFRRPHFVRARKRKRVRIVKAIPPPAPFLQKFILMT